MKKTRVMVVDDQSVARQLFELYLKSSERYELVHMVESAALQSDRPRTTMIGEV